MVIRCGYTITYYNHVCMIWVCPKVGSDPILWMFSSGKGWSTTTFVGYRISDRPMGEMCSRGAVTRFDRCRFDMVEPIKMLMFNVHQRKSQMLAFLVLLIPFVELWLILICGIFMSKIGRWYRQQTVLPKRIGTLRWISRMQLAWITRSGGDPACLQAKLEWINTQRVIHCFHVWDRCKLTCSWIMNGRSEKGLSLLAFLVTWKCKRPDPGDPLVNCHITMENHHF